MANFNGVPASKASSTIMRFLPFIFALCGCSCLVYGQTPSPTGNTPAPATTNSQPSNNAYKDGSLAKLDTSAVSLPDLLPPLHGTISLVGGRIREIDPVRDRLVVDVFGGGKMVFLFDQRTNVFKNETAASLNDLQLGDRIYLDTLLSGDEIFARTIRVVGKTTNGESSGQVVSYDPGAKKLILRDVLASRPIELNLSSRTVISQGEKTITAAQLVPGTLVTVNFAPSGTGHNVISHISVLAIPGTEYVFVGRVVHLDLHKHLLVIVDPRDNRSYDINFDPAVTGVSNDLKEGASVIVTTNFDGENYTARNITISPQPQK
jgi:hypothetical protein